MIRNERGDDRKVLVNLMEVIFIKKRIYAAQERILNTYTSKIDY